METQSPSPVERASNRILYIVSMNHAVNDGSVYLLSSLFPVVISLFGLSVLQVGILVGLGYLVSVIFQTVVGATARGGMVTRSAAHPLAVSCLLRDSGQHICVYLPLRQPPTCHRGTPRKRFRHLGDLSLDLHGTLPLSRTRCDHEGSLVRHHLRGSDRRRFGSWLGQRLSLGHVRVAVRIRKSRGSGSPCQWADSLMGESRHAREGERLRV